MKSEIYREIDFAKMSFNWGRLKVVSLVFFLIGAAAFAYQLFAGDAQRAWSAYLTNYVYWTGLAFGTFLLSPVLVLTNATWGRPVKRLSESVIFFLPVYVHFALAPFSWQGEAFWWVLHPEEQKAPWLNTPFFFARESIGLLALYVQRPCWPTIPSRATWKTWKRSPSPEGRQKRSAGTVNCIRNSLCVCYDAGGVRHDDVA